MKIELRNGEVLVRLSFDDASELGRAEVTEDSLTDLEERVRTQIREAYCCDDCGEYLQVSQYDHQKVCENAAIEYDEDDEDEDENEIEGLDEDPDDIEGIS